VDGNRLVNRPDLDQISADRGQPVNSGNFRDDMNRIGVVDKLDQTIVKQNKNHSLP
jgi:hypothetical protein